MISEDTGRGHFASGPLDMSAMKRNSESAILTDAVPVSDLRKVVDI